LATPDFARLALPHLDGLYRVARRLTARAHEAEDLVQETYLEGFRCFGSLKDPQRCRAWLFRILRNRLFQQRARERARKVAPDAGEAAGDLEREVLEAGYSDEVEGALRALPEEFRTALLLVAVEELSYEEVAEAMECPLGTVRSRVARGRALLGAALVNAEVPPRVGGSSARKGGAR
jgi:RNA polymerase sigma-70 factor (ECF subfamily)